MKKLLTIAITILVIGTAVAPLVQAQDQASLMKEQQALAKKKNRTPAENQRIMDINIEIMMLNGMTREQAEAMLAQQMGMTDQQRQQQQQQTADLKKGFEQAQEQQRQNELAGQQQQKQEEERQRQERAKAANILREWGLQKVQLPTEANTQLPAGVIVETDGNSIRLAGSNSPAALKERQRQFQDLKSQIEKIMGKKLVGSGDSFQGSLGNKRLVYISLSGEQIGISFTVTTD
jgi:hypothetical protein